MSQDIIIKKKEEITKDVDFQKVWEQGIKVIFDLSHIEDDADLVDIEKVRSKADAFVSALDNILVVNHYEELLPNLKKSFKRSTELEGLDNLLESFVIAAKVGKRNIQFVETRINELFDRLDETDEMDPLEAIHQRSEALKLFQHVYAQAIDNMTKAAKGLQTVIELERRSGGRPYGSNRTSTQKTLQLPAGSGKNNENRLIPSRTIEIEELTDYED